MPIYEYRCAACGARFEEFRKMSDPPLDECIECGVKGQVSKLVSATAFHLKGGGWYADHYGLKNGGSSSESSSDSASSSDTSSSDSSASSDASSSSSSSSSSDSSTSAD